MKIGILADIHEHVPRLRQAVTRLRQLGVDRFLVLGDVFETGAHIEETVAVLRDVEATGVWGNHELGLCHQPDLEFLARYSADVGDFFGSLLPSMEVEDLLFSHGVPSWDPTDPAIYYIGDAPWEAETRDAILASWPHRIFFMGHFHRWHLAAAAGPAPWEAVHPIVLSPAERYFVIIHAVQYGWCASFDTSTSELTPCRLD